MKPIRLRLAACLCLTLSPEGLGLLCALMGASPPLHAKSVDDAAPSFSRALALLQKDAPAGVAMLATLSQDGDPRSQSLYGTMLMEGKQVAQDVALGLAYLKMADASPDPTFDRVIGDHARAAITNYELRLPGRDILKAEQLATQMTAEVDAREMVRLQPLLAPYTRATLVKARPVSFSSDPVQLSVPPSVTSDQPMRLGCAAEDRGNCDTAPKPGTPGHCTGRLSKVDHVATVNSKEARTVVPVYPDYARRNGVEGEARVLAHIDSSGWICSAIVTGSSGSRQLDVSALEAVRQWKFVPADRAGAPAESLLYFAVSFRLFN